MSTTLPDYAELEAQLSDAGAPIAPAELHGVVCGLLCIAGRTGAADWLHEQLGTFDGEPDAVAAARSLLETLELASWSALSGTEMQFEPVLPDDDVELGTRAAALGQWCLGFIGGLALGGWNDLQPVSGADEIREIVSDFSAISHAGIGESEDADAEAAEASYMELAEYVRVGVQFVFESQLAGAAAVSARTLH